MKIVVTVEFDGRDPVAQMIKMFGEPLARSMEGVAFSQATASPGTVALSVATPVADKKPRGRPFGTAKKVEAPAAPAVEVKPEVKPEVQPVGVVTPVAIEPEKPAAPQFKLEEVQAALEKLFNSKGIEAALGTLASFGVKRARDMTPEQYAPFMERVDMLMKAPA